MLLYYSFIVVYLCNFIFAAVIPSERDASILSYNYKNYGNGTYEFSYATSNGISRNETGQLVNAGQDTEHISVRGFYSYVDQNDVSKIFQYTADKNGYNVTEYDNVEEDDDDDVYFGAVSPQVASLLGR